MVDYLCDMGAFSNLIFTHVYIGFNISGPPGMHVALPGGVLTDEPTGTPALEEKEYPKKILENRQKYLLN